ncbi:hypothetical protein PFISCL1PPCAC_14766, partial [Pristionchus fissidentatus]
HSSLMQFLSILLFVSFIHFSLQFQCIHQEEEKGPVEVVECQTYCFADILHQHRRDRRFLRRGCVKTHSLIQKVEFYLKFNQWPDKVDCPEGLSRYRPEGGDNQYFEQRCCHHNLCTNSPDE